MHRHDLAVCFRGRERQNRQLPESHFLSEIVTGPGRGDVAQEAVCTVWIECAGGRSRQKHISTLGECQVSGLVLLEEAGPVGEGVSLVPFLGSPQQMFVRRHRKETVEMATPWLLFFFFIVAKREKVPRASGKVQSVKGREADWMLPALGEQDGITARGRAWWGQ